MTIAETFTAAAHAFAALLDEPQVPQRWQQPSALAGLTVGELVAHVNTATAFLRPLLDTTPPTDARVARAARYYAGMEGGEGEGHDFLRAMAEKGAAKGPEANADHFRSTVAELSTRLATEDPDRVLDARPTLPFAITVADFTATRVVELVVHGDDLATSVDADFEPPAAAADMAVAVLVSAARANHGDLAVVRALARRERAAADVFPVL